MAEMLETLENNGELSKALYDFFGHIATSAILKANEKNKAAGSSKKDETLLECKSVPVTKSDSSRSHIKQTVCDVVESGRPRSSNKNTDAVVDSSLGRPRYEWRESETDMQGLQRTSLAPKQIFSVYVGHLPIDITQGELEDLFSDIGEIVDSYVFPSTNGHTYTYGFVRFCTLEEAEDAVREKHLKVIGNNQINVELSSSTRRQLQDGPEDEESSPLLRKEYPKGPRQTISDNDEKQVVEKMKTSLRRLKSKNISSVGNYSAEETFENIKIVLKMLINYPMTLANPSADRDEGKSSTDVIDSESKHQTRTEDFLSREILSGEVTNQQATLPHYQTTGRLPAFALGAVNSAGTNTEKPLSSRNELTNSGISCIPLIEQNDPPVSQGVNLSLVNKVREFLDSSSGEDNVQPSGSKYWENNVRNSKHSLSGSSTDGERYSGMKNGMGFEDRNIDSLDPLPINAMKGQPVRTLSVVSDPSKYDQVKNKNDFPSQLGKQNLGSSNGTSHSVYESLLVQTISNQYMQGSLSVYDSFNYNSSTRTLPYVEPFTSASHVNDTFASHDSSSYDCGIPNHSVELPNSFQTSSVNEAKFSPVVEKQEVEGQHTDNVIPGCSTGGKVLLKNEEQVLLDSSSTVNVMSECMSRNIAAAEHSLGNSSSLNGTSKSMAFNSLPFPASYSSSKCSTARNLSPNFTSDAKLTNFLGKDTLLQGSKGSSTQTNDTHKNLNHKNSTTRSCSLFPPPPSSLNATSFEQLELSLDNSVARVTESFCSENRTFPPCCDDSSLSTNQALLEETSTFGLFNDSSQHHFEWKISDQRTVDNSLPTEKTAFNKHYKPSLQPENKLALSDRKVYADQRDQVIHHTKTAQENSPEDNTSRGNDLSPASSWSSSSTDTPEIVHHSRRVSTKNVETSPIDKRGSDSSMAPVQEDSVVRANVPAVSRKGELDSQTQNTVFSPSVQRLFDSFRAENGRSITLTRPRVYENCKILTNENGLKSPGRRCLAPSFSFPPSQKHHEEKGLRETNLSLSSPRQNKESSISTFPAYKANFQRTQTTNDMIDDSAILSISNNNMWKATSDMSEFDFGFDDDNDASKTTLVESFEPENDLLNSMCPTDDAETVKLKDQLAAHVLKLEEKEQIFSSYPQRRRKRLPRVFDDHARGLELETRIHDAEILLQKKEEMCRTRSNDRELAYEKEMFHSANNNPLLAQFAREMKKESLRSEISITELKCKILELKIEQYQQEETAQI